SAAEAPNDVAERLLAARKEQPADPTKPKSKRRPKAVPTLEDQVTVFIGSGIEGFSDAAWLKNHRGLSGSRRLKRHRDAAIAEAKELLGKEALDELLAAGRYEVVLERAHAVLSKTDLVTKKQLEPLVNARRSSALALSLRNYLHEVDTDGAHFDEFLRRLGRSSTGRYTWPLMTALRALVNPEADVCIKPSVFVVQARSMSPSLAKKLRPTGATYNRYRAMAQELRTRLAGLGLEAADMLDVYDFVWATMRPAAAQSVEAAREARLAATEAETATEAATDAPAATDGAPTEPSGTPDEAEAA
ncbi:MAG: hypothetical protein AAF721_03150, partial [Myxococcota bacterium]